MKFLVDKCLDCGLDLTTAEPAEVTTFAGTVSGTCPGCGRSYLMVEVEAPEPEPEVTPAPEPEPEPEPETPSEPAAEAEPEPETPGEEKGGD